MTHSLITRPLALGLPMLLAATLSAAETPALAPAATATLTRYCRDCHGQDLAEARINLEQMAKTADFGREFKDWEKARSMLRQGKMPPPDAPQPSPSERTATATAIEKGLNDYIARHAGDPGPVVLRRLTSAEYAYTLTDLTGLDLRLDRTIGGDAAGGEGFTNVGGAQFIQDSALERYLEAARLVAEHAVIGSGPLAFYADPGQTGRELSAINRIKDIYRQHGFRTAAGEGATPFGLDLYPRAMFVAWRFRHRAALSLGEQSLEQLARQEGLSAGLCEHVSGVLSGAQDSFPLLAIKQQWRALPLPGSQPEAKIRAAVGAIARELREWQSMLAAAAGDEEEAAVLTEGEIAVQSKHSFTTALTWEENAKSTEFELSVTSASGRPVDGALVIWRNPRLRLRRLEGRRGFPVPLTAHLAPETLAQLKPGQHPLGTAIGPNDFVLGGEQKVLVKLIVPTGAVSAQLTVDVELDRARAADSIVRCRLWDPSTVGKTVAAVGAASALLAHPDSPAVSAWQTGVAEFARLLPEVSHREPAPSDRDPIPPPYDNTYNLPERNHYHYAIKYCRDDRFLYEHVLDDAARTALDQAWTDLLTSFEYHDANLRFVAKKFKLNLNGKGIADLDAGTIATLPEEPRAFVQRWHAEYLAMQQALRAAEGDHVADALRLAERAWRRPLASSEQQRLRDFYTSLRGSGNLDHTAALRALLVRILLAPAFLYRAESSTVSPAVGSVPLSDWELASRLSFFLWSSLPDEELRRAAAAGELRDREQLAAQTRRMLKDPKSRRLAAEFFGQWLGFYRFDDFAGIDAGRFPEFNEPLRAAMYDEAVSFFEHLIRADRPPAEMLFADYTFANSLLARHYGLETAADAASTTRVENVAAQHRGGILGMGAVLGVTSAPLRTSAVKRGDWLLRRVLGTPVPPPPADAGSIPAEEELADELTVRQRLEKHRTAASCVNCHARIDPLGFALEHYDSLGRWRETYQDGKPIDPTGVLSDGTKIDGLASLRDYLRRQQPQFERNLSGKLLGYALGRTELASDRPLLDEMQSELKRGAPFSALVVRIVTSHQFRHRRQ
jgi:uncharacterized protein DUF1592/uncharacterized protein DUF1588/uncharacterized protein DUF1585/uncharacterized protein DUF1587/uncharacterized protein DUF1595